MEMLGHCCKYKYKYKKNTNTIILTWQDLALEMLGHSCVLGAWLCLNCMGHHVWKVPSSFLFVPWNMLAITSGRYLHPFFTSMCPFFPSVRFSFLICTHRSLFLLFYSKLSYNILFSWRWSSRSQFSQESQMVNAVATTPCKINCLTTLNSTNVIFFTKNYLLFHVRSTSSSDSTPQIWMFSLKTITQVCHRDYSGNFMSCNRGPFPHRRGNNLCSHFSLVTFCVFAFFAYFVYFVW